MKKILNETQRDYILLLAKNGSYDRQVQLLSVLTAVDEAEKRLAELEPPDLRTEELTFKVTYDANVLSLEKVTAALQKVLKGLPFTGVDLIVEGPRLLEDKEKTVIKDAINHCWQARYLYKRENNHSSAKIVDETISGLHDLLTPTEVTEELTRPEDIVMSPGEGFRWLDGKEILQEGDQLRTSFGEWMNTFYVGGLATHQFIYRRRIN